MIHAERLGEEGQLREGILRGARAIAHYLGIPVRRAYYLLSTGALPARREGARTYVTTKQALAEYYQIKQGA